MKKLLLNSILLFCSFQLFAQGEADNWVLGGNTQILFDEGDITLSTTGVFNYSGNEGESMASISSKDGDLLFYVLGNTVYDNNHKLITHTLVGNQSSLQGNSILKKPSSEDEYLIFSTRTPDYNKGLVDSLGLYFSVVKVSNDTIIFTTKNELISNTHITECLTVVPQAVKNKFWLITHGTGQGFSDSYLSYEVSANGVNKTPVVSNTGTPIQDGFVNGNSVENVISSIKSNSCYTKLAFTNLQQGFIDILDFDNTTGSVTFDKNITGYPIGEIYSIEFSPSGQYLYVSEYFNKTLSQLDLTISDVVGSKNILGIGSKARLGQLQLAPNGKIYFANHVWSTNGSIGVINNPNEKGVNSNIIIDYKSSIFLDNQTITMGLPNFPKHLVVGKSKISVDESNKNCIGESIKFSAHEAGQIVQPNSWTVGGVIEGSGSQFDYTFQKAGEYNVGAIINNNCGQVDTVSFVVKIIENIIPSVGYVDFSANRCDTSIIGLSVQGHPDVESFTWSHQLSNSYIGNAVNYSGDLPYTYTISPNGETLDTLGDIVNNQELSAQVKHYTEFEMLQKGKLLSTEVIIFHGWQSTCSNSTFFYELRKDSVSGGLILKDSLETIDCKEYSLPINLILDKGTYFLVYTGKSGSASFDDGDYNFIETSNEIIKNKGGITNWAKHNGPFSSFVVQKLISCAESIDFEITEKCNILSAFENKVSNDLVVYPNPSSNSFTIDNVDKKITSLEIYNTLGEMVESTEVDGITFTVGENLVSGAYVIKLLSVDSVASYRVIKQ